MPFEPMGHAVPGADLEALHDLAREAEGQRAVEVGSWAGASTLVLAQEFDTVYCIDTWKPTDPEDRLTAVARDWPPRRAFQTFCANMGRELLYTVVPCVGHSLTWALVWNQPIDLLFLDGDHRYESVKADLAAWTTHVRSGGLVVVHDYGGFPGVTRAVDEAHPGASRAGHCLAWWRKGQEES